MQHELRYIRVYDGPSPEHPQKKVLSDFYELYTVGWSEINNTFV